MCLKTQKTLFLSFFCFFCSSFFALAQQPLQYDEVVELTYWQWVTKDYKSLKTTAQQALKQGLDGYDLRLRLGAVYYAEQNYERALAHFERAYQMNPADTLGQEYYYWALQFTLRTADAVTLAAKMQPEMQQKVGFETNKTKKFAFETIGLTGGVFLNNNFNLQNQDFRQGNVYAENTLQGGAYLGNLYLNTKIGNRLNLYHNLSFFQVQGLGVVQSAFEPTQKRNYDNPNFSYVLGGNYALQKGWTLGGFGSFYQENSNYFSTVYNPAAFRLTYIDKPYRHQAWSGGVYLAKRHKNMGFQFAFSAGNLSKVQQLQTEIGWLWYPLGNTNFYTQTTAAYLNNNQKHQFVILQTIGGKLTKKLGYEISGSYGNHQNYLSKDGLSSYNTIEPILATAGSSLVVSFKNLQFIPAYTYQLREANYLQIRGVSEVNTINNFYHNHLIKCTIQWKF